MAKKIYINPGHSNTDPGAVGYVVEREVNVKVSEYMNSYLLNNYDVETRMNPGTMGSLTTIAKDANNWGADLIVSNHFNAGGGDGYEALVYSEKNKALGQMFEKHVKAIGQNSRGVKCRPDLGILRLTDMPAVLNECAFVDNKKDIQDWNEDKELKTIGEALAKAAADWCALPKKSSKPSKNDSKGFLVKVKVSALNIRSGPGTSNKITGVITDKGVYTIVQTNGKWGKLKSGKGWIHMDYVKRL